MAEPMTLARFCELADAYGGVVARWPERDRDAAMRVASSPEGAKALAAASVLDETLDMWRVPAPAAEFRDRVLSTAHVPRRRLVKRARVWWSGIGVAAALTGATAGAGAVAVLAPIDASDGATSFGDVLAQEG